jgi:hypothetical protein
MRRTGPVLAVAVVVLANALALLAVARNRAGEPEAEVLLTERELPLAPWTDESTGTFLQLDWQRSPPGSKDEAPWLDQAKLESLGFDCSVPAEAPGARERYLRMAARPAYIVLEHDGEAFRRWLEAAEAQPGVTDDPPGSARVSASRLVPIDVGRDARELRRLYPDRSRDLIVPAIVRPRWTCPDACEGDGAGKATLSVRIQSLLVREVHVPRSLAAPLEAFRATLPPPPRHRHVPPRYEVRLLFGARHEPWVAEVRLTAP